MQVLSIQCNAGTLHSVQYDTSCLQVFISSWIEYETELSIFHSAVQWLYTALNLWSNEMWKCERKERATCNVIAHPFHAQLDEIFIYLVHSRISWMNYSGSKSINNSSECLHRSANRSRHLMGFPVVNRGTTREIVVFVMLSQGLWCCANSVAVPWTAVLWTAIMLIAQLHINQVSGALLKPPLTI
jgi:hypothetical protein